MSELADLETINSVWSSGAYIGNAAKPTCRVMAYRYWTVEEVPFSQNGKNRGPARTWTEGGSGVEIPNKLIKTISINRSISSDTATMTLTMKNAEENITNNTYIPNAKGKFSQRRFIDGAAVSNAPWGTNGYSDWGNATGTPYTFSYGVVAQGNMFKTYQGFGGTNVLSGVWIADTVNYDSKGNITLNCRDVGALLVDQNLYFPIVPDQCYPTMFYSASWNRDEMGYADGIGKIPMRTNYDDFTDIIVACASWGGFCNKVEAETTGSDSTSVIGADTFDKRPPIDAIKTIRDWVGYNTLVDRNGTFIFNRTNWWSGNPTWTANEDNILLNHGAIGSKTADRSAFIAAESDPYYLGGNSTEAPIPRRFSYNTYEDGPRNQLHGIHRLAIMPLSARMTPDEGVTLAELTGLRSWFQRRKARITVVGNPEFDVNKQILVKDKVTWDHHLHFITGVESTQDLDSGSYTSTLETHWLGPDPSFRIQIEGGGHVRYNGNSGEGGAEASGVQFTDHFTGAEVGAIGQTEMTPEYTP